MRGQIAFMKGLLTLLLLGLTAQTAAAATPPVRVAAVPAASVVRIDGVLDDAVWATAAPATGFLQRDPEEGRAPTESTRLRLAFDRQALYVAVQMLDRQAGRIGRRLSRRDDAPDADSVAVFVDPLHDGRSGAMFEVSAAGVQRDALIYNDSSLDYSWDGVWESAAAVDERGWTVEVRIPFSQLRLPSSGGRPWGLMVIRYLRRNNEADWLPLVPKNDTRLASGMADLMGLERVDATLVATRTAVVPHAVLRNSSNVTSAATAGAMTGALGVDVARGLSRHLKFDATINPDFAQVEGDPSAVNLTAFEPFLAERRPFFTESAPLFNTFGNAGGAFDVPAPILFYSRRIGEAPPSTAPVSPLQQPTATPVIGAAKVSGIAGTGWKVTALDAVTGSTSGESALDPRVSLQTAPAVNYLATRALNVNARGGIGVIGTAVTRAISGPPTPGDFVPTGAIVGGLDGYRFLDRAGEWVIGGQASASRVSWNPAGRSTLVTSGTASSIATASAYRVGTTARGGIPGPPSGSPGSGNGNGGGTGKGGTTGPPSTTPADPPPFSSSPTTPGVPGVSGAPPGATAVPQINTGPARVVDLSAGALSGWSANANLHRNRGALRINADAWAISPGFEANDLGFVPQADLQGLRGEVSLNGYEPNSVTRYRGIGVSKGWSRTFAGEKQSDRIDVWTSTVFLNYWSADGGVSVWRQAYDASTLRGGPSLLVPAGKSWWTSLGTDSRQAVFVNTSAYHSWNDVGDAATALSAALTIKPTERVSVSAGPTFDRSDVSAQYVTTITPTINGTASTQYVFAALHATDVALTTQLNLIFSNRLSFQLYMQPFVARGEYTGLKALAAAGTNRFLRYGVDTGSISYDAATAQYLVRTTASASESATTIGNPDFNPAVMDLHAVLRWEWRRGSMLYAVWTQHRSGTVDGSGVSTGSLADTFRAAADNAFALKMTYWLER